MTEIYKEYVSLRCCLKCITVWSVFNKIQANIALVLVSSRCVATVNGHCDQRLHGKYMYFGLVFQELEHFRFPVSHHDSVDFLNSCEVCDWLSLVRARLSNEV